MAAGKTDDIRVRLSEDVRSELELIAAERGEALSVIVREALRAYLTSRSPGMVCEGQSPYLARPPDTPARPPAPPRAAS